MKEKFLKFMEGRYGVDAFARFTMVIALACIVISIFFPGRSVIGALLNTVGLLAIIYTYFRMFSRNVSKRYAENEAFLAGVYKIRNFFRSKKGLWKQRKVYHIYKCPGCRQKIRIPKGKGKIEIRCPKCGTTFIKKS